MGRSLPGSVGFGCAWQALGARSLNYLLGDGNWIWGCPGQRTGAMGKASMSAAVGLWFCGWLYRGRRARK